MNLISTFTANNNTLKTMKLNWVFYFSFTLQVSSVRDFIIQHGCCRWKAWKWPDVWSMRRFPCFSGTSNIILINITVHLFLSVWNDFYSFSEFVLCIWLNYRKYPNFLERLKCHAMLSVDNIIFFVLCFSFLLHWVAKYSLYFYDRYRSWKYSLICTCSCISH